jgi:glycosyltransferase involved in cell wall biosynthesis
LALTRSEASDSERVVFTGWLDGARKLAALRSAQLLALTSWQENFALSVVEGMAFGVPAFVSDRVNLADEIREAQAGWVTPIERQTQVSILADILRNADERRRRGRHAQRLVEQRFTWPAVGSWLLEIYSALLAGTPLPGTGGSKESAKHALTEI